MIPPFDAEGYLPPGTHAAAWQEFQERFCIFAHSDRRLQLCRRIAQLIAEARAAHIVERVIFGGSFVSARPEPHDFDCIVVLHTGTPYKRCNPFNGGSLTRVRHHVATVEIYLLPGPINRRWPSMATFLR